MTEAARILTAQVLDNVCRFVLRSCPVRQIGALKIKNLGTTLNNVEKIKHTSAPLFGDRFAQYEEARVDPAQTWVELYRCPLFSTARGSILRRLYPVRHLAITLGHEQKHGLRAHGRVLQGALKQPFGALPEQLGPVGG